MKTLLFATCLFWAFGAQAQLNLNHEFNGQTFVLNQDLVTSKGTTVNISRLQYYVSGIEFKHDNGVITPASDYLYINAGLGNSNFTLTHNGNIAQMEGVRFHVGVDSATNHADPSQYPVGHPLEKKSPSNHWGWAAGYHFFMIDGMIDTDADGVPDKSFSVYAIDDQYLTAVDVDLQGTNLGNIAEIDLKVDITNWIEQVALDQVGYAHGISTYAAALMGNAGNNDVFTPLTVASSTSSVKQEKNILYVDAQMAYAPTIFYAFNKKSDLRISIMNLQGQIVLQENNLPHQGEFFIYKELPTGTYIAQLENSEGIKESIKFIVQQ